MEEGVPTQSDMEEEEEGMQGNGLSHEMAARERGEGEEGRDPIRAQTPQKVTAQDREHHNLTHTPFRSWCRICVRARGRNMYRKKEQR